MERRSYFHAVTLRLLTQAGGQREMELMSAWGGLKVGLGKRLG